MRSRVLVIVAVGLLLGAGAPSPKEKEDAAKQEQQKLQGVWKPASVETGGEKREEKDIANWKLTIAGNKITAKDGDELLNESTFTLDPSAKPKAIDVTCTGGADKGKDFKGIYLLEDDTLTICVTEGKDRPEGFVSKANTDFTLVVLKRQKP
jgi:uncharacterized protein (TIGR03067 family)